MSINYGPLIAPKLCPTFILKNACHFLITGLSFDKIIVLELKPTKLAISKDMNSNAIDNFLIFQKNWANFAVSRLCKFWTIGFTYPFHFNIMIKVMKRVVNSPESRFKEWNKWKLSFYTPFFKLLNYKSHKETVFEAFFFFSFFSFILLLYRDIL